MITSNNIKEVFNDISDSEIAQLSEKPNSYISIELNVFNAGHTTSVATYDEYDSDTEHDMLANGMLYMHTEQFLDLYNSVMQ